MFVSYSVVCLVYCLFGTYGFYLYGKDTDGDISLNFDESWFSNIAFLALILSGSGTFPLVFKGFINVCFFNWALW